MLGAGTSTTVTNDGAGLVGVGQGTDPIFLAYAEHRFGQRDQLSSASDGTQTVAEARAQPLA